MNYTALWKQNKLKMLSEGIFWEIGTGNDMLPSKFTHYE
jgi:hypothetical protein